MEKSMFQFTNPILKRLQFDVHDSFSKKGRLEMGINVTVNCERNKNEDTTLTNSALVMVTVSIGEKDNTTPFYIEADEEATFKWRDGVYSEEQLETLLNHNAVVLLLSYLRPIISNITASSPFPAYNLPYIDLTAREEH